MRVLIGFSRCPITVTLDRSATYPGIARAFAQWAGVAPQMMEAAE